MRGQFRRVLGTLSLVLAAGWLTIADVRAEGAHQIDEAKLDSFADAYQAATDVYHEMIRGIKSEEEIEGMQVELKAAVEKAIENTDGITLAEFQEIEEVVLNDEDLNKRVAEKLQAAGHAQ